MPINLTNQINRFSSNAATGIRPGYELEDAIKKAHADMSRRAKGHTDDIRNESVRFLCGYFRTHSPFAIADQGDFDEWHRKACERYCAQMNAFITRNGFSFVITYGRAQKVLNMTFKYLFCTTAYRKNVEKIAAFLHMTLDGYTLNWYKEMVIPYFNRLPGTVTKLKKGSVSDWSKMNEPGMYQYKDIQEGIREYLSSASDYQYSILTNIVDEEFDNGTPSSKILVSVPFDPARKTPFYAEFIVWAGEIVRAKMNGLLKGLNATYENWADDEWAVNAKLKTDLKRKLTTLAGSI